jgi:exopolyphosphatase/guanosine-5'-triphosphate,3'-diphosphate pyrophosphatase
VRKAVIDVGSNSVLLLIAEKDASGWRTIDEATAVTALGEGTKSTGNLGERGMAATLAALADFYKRAASWQVEEVVAGATMAARIAANTPDFLSRAERQGTPVEVLSGEEEARLGFESVANDPMFAAYDAVTIVDPGGHSTEIVIGERSEGAWNRIFLRSFPIGTLSLLDGALAAERPEPPAILQATTTIDDLYAAVEFPLANGPVVVLGATGTNLISIREGLEKWDPQKVHGAYLTYEEVGRAVGWLMAMTIAQRKEIAGMEPGREPTLPAGALILERALHALHAEGCYVSVRGWRHALL